MERRLVNLFAVFVLLAALSGCAATQVQPPPAPVAEPAPLPFPPQKVMVSGDYAGFLAENQKALKAGGGETSLDVVLFNIGFLYSYSKSPYYNTARALRIFEQLVREYPQSPWAYQAKAWMDMIRKTIVAEEKQRQLKGKVKSKEAALSSKDAAITSKDAAINDLQNQIDRSREIDVEMDRRERELLK